MLRKWDRLIWGRKPLLPKKYYISDDLGNRRGGNGEIKGGGKCSRKLILNLVLNIVPEEDVIFHNYPEPNTSQHNSKLHVYEQFLCKRITHNGQWYCLMRWYNTFRIHPRTHYHFFTRLMRRKCPCRVWQIFTILYPRGLHRPSHSVQWLIDFNTFKESKEKVIM